MPVKSVHEIKPCGGEEGEKDGRREDTVRQSEHDTRPQGRKGVYMTNQSFASENTRKNIPWAEVAKIFHLEHLSQHRTGTPVTGNKKSPEEVSDAEFVASLNRVYNPAEIEAALIAEEEEDAPDPELSKYYPAPYYVKHNCLGYVKHTKDGEVDVQLCNFVPRISCEILYDDGEEVTREYEITVKDREGNVLPTFRVPAQSFGKLDWVGGNLPARCTLDVTGSVEKHIVHAVKETAAHADLRHVYAHTGWIRQDGEMHFLLPGSPFFEVELDGKCANYGMICGEEPADLGWLTGMLQLNVVPHDVMLPLMALKLDELYRSPGYLHMDKLDFLFQALVKTSRLETGVIQLDKKPACLFDTVAQAMSGIVYAAEKKKIAVSVDCPENLTFSHDSKWTSEALFNLLDNAVKYTPAGGKIAVSVVLWEMYVEIKVADTGKGISESNQAAIFRRFYREEEVHEQQGVGIGLYLAREIVTRQGGYIKVVSEPGKGSEFSIMLPTK